MDPIAVPSGLYSLDDLLAGWAPGDPLGITRTRDFALYRAFVVAGGLASRDLDAALAFARHDAVISVHLRRWTEAARPSLVGIMGGHDVARDAPVYARVARLARTLTARGFTVVTGGGPGAMEAAHLGAASAAAEPDALDRALERIAAEGTTRLPASHEVIAPDGTVDRELAEEAGRWLETALEVRRTLLPARIAESLAVPTWLYGGEPTNPFATRYAKFFSNSLREETLVTRSRTGIVYAPGGGGTLREAFEDFEDGWYARDVDAFTPMVFLNHDDYWHSDDPARPAVVELAPVLEQGVRASRPGVDPAPFLAKVLFTVDESRIVAVLAAQRGPASAALGRLLAGEAR